VAGIELIVSIFILTLTEGNSVKHLLGVVTKSLCKVFDILDWVYTRRQDEVNWGGSGRVLVGALKNLLGVASHIAINKSITIGHNFADKVIKSSCCSVRAEGAHDKKLFEWHRFELLPVKWELFSLGCKFVVPILETFSSTVFNMLGELLKHLDLNNLLDAEPDSLRHPFLECNWNRNILLLWAEDKEVHLECRILGLQ